MIDNTLFQKLLDEVEMPVLLLVVAEDCENATPVMQYHVEKLVQDLKGDPVRLQTLCVPEATMPFPRLATPTLYFFLPKHHTPAFYRHGNILKKFPEDIQTIRRMMTDKTSYQEAKMTPDLYEKFVEVERFLEEEKAVMSKTHYPVHFRESRRLARETWEQAKRTDRTLPILLPIRASYRRYAECQKCEHYDSVFFRCAACTCFIRVRPHLEKESCPLGKW